MDNHRQESLRKALQEEVENIFENSGCGQFETPEMGELEVSYEDGIGTVNLYDKETEEMTVVRFRILVEIL